MNRDLRDLILFIILLIGLVVIIYLMFTEGSKCLSEPLMYGIKTKSKDGFEFSCGCSWNHPRTSIVLINSTDVKIIK